MTKKPLVYDAGLTGQIQAGDTLDAAALPVAAHNEAAADKLVAADDPRLTGQAVLSVMLALQEQAMRRVWALHM